MIQMLAILSCDRNSYNGNSIPRRTTFGEKPMTPRLHMPMKKPSQTISYPDGFEQQMQKRGKPGLNGVESGKHSPKCAAFCGCIGNGKRGTVVRPQKKIIKGLSPT